MLLRCVLTPRHPRCIRGNSGAPVVVIRAVPGGEIGTTSEKDLYVAYAHQDSDHEVDMNAQREGGKPLLVLLAGLLWGLSVTLAVEAAPGDLDPTFGSGGRLRTDFGNGRTDQANALAIQADGKLVVAGSSAFSIALARYNPNGTLDPSFGSRGLVLSDFGVQASALVIQADGKIIVAGNTNHFVLERYNTDGTLDPSFGAGGRVSTDFGPFTNDIVRALAIQADGKLVVAGSSASGSFTDFALARYTADGVLDTSFGTARTGKVTTRVSGGDEARALVIQGDGKIVMAGTSAGLTVDFALVRYTADGTLDTTFGGGGVVHTDFGGVDQAFALASQADGKLVAAGNSRPGASGFDDFALARYSADGVLDTTFGNGGRVLTDFGDGERVRALAIQADGRIVAAGSRGLIFLDFALARYNSNGTLDTDFGAGGKVTTDFTGTGSSQDQAFALVIQADGKLVVAGSSFPDFALARYEGLPNTPTGSMVTVELSPVMLTFANVTQAGVTSLTTSSTGPQPPTGFTLGNPPTYYELATTASFNGSVTVCINYAAITFNNEGLTRLFHLEDPNWVDTTVSLDTTNKIICGRVTSLSPFAILEPTPQPTTLEANAGADQVVDEGVIVILDGSGSHDSSGRSITYQWSQVAGPAVTLDDATSATPSFMAPHVSANQVLTFELVVNNGLADSPPDSVDVTVKQVNNPPTADAGTDGTVKAGAVRVLSGLNSFDPDGDAIVSYQWTQTAGPAVSLAQAASATPSFVAPTGSIGQSVTFSLIVSDGKEVSAADSVTITIVENSAPVADAGPDQVKDEGSIVTLDASRSHDVDLGDSITYQWQQTSGPSVLLDNATTRTPTFRAPLVASLTTITFDLTVTDDDFPAAFNRKSHTDSVTISVRNINDPPSCHLARAKPDVLWPPDHKLKKVVIGGVMDTDSIHNRITLKITGVTQDEPVFGRGQGRTSPDAVIRESTPADRVLIRAERSVLDQRFDQRRRSDHHHDKRSGHWKRDDDDEHSDDANGRVYQIHFTATDGLESCTGAVSVSVPKTRRVLAVDDGQNYDSTVVKAPTRRHDDDREDDVGRHGASDDTKRR